MKLQELFDYIQFLHKFAEIERTVKIGNKKGWENDVEHSYQLALVAWYVAERRNLDVNRETVFKYALAHDLVEVYAGDTDPHKHSKDSIESKEKRERQALIKIKQNFPDFQDLHRTIEAYEKLEDTEAQFVYLLDKILPIINTHLSKDSYYSDIGISFKRWEQWLNEKRDKVKLDEDSLQELLEEVIEFFRNTDKGFFKS